MSSCTQFLTRVSLADEEGEARLVEEEEDAVARPLVGCEKHQEG
jgi:hypothetical protein